MRDGARPEPSKVGRWVPMVDTVRTYEKSWFGRDITAGLVVTALLVPAGMGYAQAAGLPAINGLYATMVPLLAYAVFGPSRILVMGPDSSLAPLIAASILPLAASGSAEAATLAAMLSLLVGGLCVLAGLLRFGFLTDLLSLPIRIGYINGIALTVIVSQLPKLCGFSVDAEGVIEGTADFVTGVRDGEVIGAALLVGLASLLTILVFKAYLARIPGVLVAVVGAIVATAFLDLDIPVVGALPQGLPAFAWPDATLSEISSLFAGAVGIAFVAFADTSVLSRTYAARLGEEVAPDQELVALGAVNVAGGLFQGFPVSSSSSRTPVAESAGARTQLTGVVGAIAVAVLVVFFPGVTTNLPTAALAAVVIGAAIHIADVPAMVRFLRTRPADFVLCLVAFGAVAVLGSVTGIFVAIAVSILDFLRRAWRPHSAELVRVDGLKGYHDLARHPEGRRIPGLVLYRFDAPLFFANAGSFQDEVIRLVDHTHPDTRWLVVTAEPMTDIDSTAAEMLSELHDDLAERRITLAFAELKGHVRDGLDRHGMVEHVGRDLFFPTVGEAVKAYRAAEDVTWVDWEEREEREGPDEHDEPEEGGSHGDATGAA